MEEVPDLCQWWRHDHFWKYCQFLISRCPNDTLFPFRRYLPLRTVYRQSEYQSALFTEVKKPVICFIYMCMKGNLTYFLLLISEMKSMFVMFDETGAPKPCHVRTSVSWLTDSMEHFNKSHWATRDFYNNVTQCIVQGPYGENQTADPTQMIYFPFSK